MILYSYKYIQFQFIGILFIFLSMGFILNSCERDEIAILKPVEIDKSCDTNNVSFKEFIKPAIDKNCKECHNNSLNYRGINLDGYDNIKKNAVNGELRSSIYGSMGGYINNDCDIAKIQAWINQASLNN